MDATLQAEKRDGRGKNEARRLRASGRIPAVVYGAEKGKAVPIAVDPKMLLRILHSESGVNTLIGLAVDGGDTRVLACAVHGVLSGPAIERLEAAPIDQVIITNTIPLSTERARGCTKIKQLSVARLLGQAIRSIHEETSVSSLFV